MIGFFNSRQPFTALQSGWLAVLLGITIALALAAPNASATSNSTSVTSLSVGYDYSCAVLSDGRVRCWGYNNHGQLGDGTQTRRLKPVTVQGIDNAAAVSASDSTTCALLRDGTVKCWGTNSTGQLGNGSKLASLTPVQVLGLTDATELRAGGSSNCAVRKNGGIACWGDNFNGELGNGSRDQSSVPVAVAGISSAVDMYIGDRHACAVLADHTVECWGARGFYMPTVPLDQLTPAPIAGVSTAVSVDGQALDSCAVLLNGRLKCWGVDGGAPGQKLIRPGLTQVRQFSAGFWDPQGFRQNCAIVSGGRVQCRGNWFKWPKVVDYSPKHLGHATQVATAYDHTCAVVSGTSIKCWGRNNRGQLGDGTNKNRRSPTLVARLASPTPRTGTSPPATTYVLANPGQPLSKNNSWVIKPTGFVLFQDGQWVLQNLTWTNWGSAVANAEGESNASDAIPNAAQGKRIITWAKVTLSKPGIFHGRRIYRCFKVTVPPPADYGETSCLRRVGTLIIYGEAYGKSGDGAPIGTG